MKEKAGDPLNRIDWWVKKFQAEMSNQVELHLDAKSNLEIWEIKELYVLNKIATLTVAMESLNKKIDDLER